MTAVPPPPVLPDLPVRAALPELARVLAAGRAAVLAAPPGAGKTTLVPLALLGAPWLGGRGILMLEPRRLAARAAAARMAALLGEPVGATVGHRIRFDVKVSGRTRIEVVTEGILTRRLQSDPGLEGVGLVIFDEFHERHLESDLALALALDVQRSLREELRLLVMSATLDAAPVAALLGGAPVLEARGRAHPVEVRYLARDPEGPIGDSAAAGVRRALAADAGGDVLAFLPGAGEIRRARALLAADPPDAGIALHALYGDLPSEAQERALRPDPAGRRKVVLATSIAETSLTIEGVRAVVDAGWSRVPRFDPATGLGRLVTVRAAKATAAQRAGRAGRLGPGVCFRLWSEATQRGLPEHAAPEIRAADLVPLALELARWGARRAEDLAWLDPPPEAALARARALLAELGALDANGAITAAGRALAELPLHPRLAHMLRRAAPLGLAALACDVAALLSERDVLRGDAGRSIDLFDRHEALRAFRARGPAAAAARGADAPACAAADRAARQWRKLAGAGAPPGEADPEELGLLVAIAYPDRVAWRRDGAAATAGGRYLLASGRGARLGRAGLAEPLLAAAALDGGDGEAVIHLAAPVSLEQLRARLPERIVTDDAVRWDPRAERVVARREERLGRIVLSERPLDPPDPARARAAMLDGVRALGIAALPWTDATRGWQARVLSLRSWLPEDGWPDVADEALAAGLDAWLAPWLEGVTRRDQLARVDLAAALAALLPWERRARLEEGAPVQVRVPSGALRRLQYAPGQPPVLAVKLQELFGSADGPRVAWGRIAVTLHLLSPAGRPIQVTQDLRSFWERTYPEVRKELRGRYPRHPWPEDPWSAPPTARAKRRAR